MHLHDVAKRLLARTPAQAQHADAAPARPDALARDLRELKAALAALLPRDDEAQRIPSEVHALVRSVHDAMDTLITACEADAQGAAAAAFRKADSSEEDGHHHHHGGTTAKLLRKFIGTSDFDESMHVLVQLKAGLSALTEDKSDAGASRLQAFQLEAVPHGAGDLAGDIALSGLLGGAGTLALLAGRSERREATHEKKSQKAEKRELEARREGLQARLAAVANGSDTQDARLLQRQLRIVEWKIARAEFRLRHVGKQRELGRGSEIAGYAMVSKAVIDLCSKLTGYLDSGAAAAAGGASGFATIPLSPIAAAAGLYMGVNARSFTSAQLKDFRAQLDVARQKLAPLIAQLPEDARDAFNRFFEQGKWTSHGDMLQSFKRLLGIFTGGMAGYTATIGGLSIVDIVSLAAGSAVVADLTLSGGVVAVSTAVLIGTYGFLKHHARFHEYDEWMNAADGEVDLELMAELAAGGGNLLGLNLDTLSFIENKETRRQDFLHDLAWNRHGLRFDGLRAHSTDSDAVRDAVSGKQTESKSSGYRRTGLTWRNMQALGKATGSMLRGGMQRAKRSYGEATDYLTRTRLASLLSEPATAQPLRAHMKRDVEEQVALLERMLSERIAACGDAAPEVAAIGDGVDSSHLNALRTGLLRTGTLHARANELLQALDGEGQPDNAAMARYLNLLQWDPALPDEAARNRAPRALAEYLMEGAPEQYRQSRLRLHRGQLETASLIPAPDAGPVRQLPPIPEHLGAFDFSFDIAAPGENDRSEPAP
ncbi:hypothetical protein [Noviherbaspirillum aridicola]|uniref:hypothetical protein n=1 Tax=Noviherbaspirillum aridicola TaxID=2849687 RepID=UPI001C809335|nr:hypothetical protein [Noviherbaspirillum aridicola]